MSTNYGEAPREHVEGMAKQFREQFRPATRAMTKLEDELMVQCCSLTGELTKTENRLTASLRALEEKNEVLLVAETALAEVEWWTGFDMRSGAIDRETLDSRLSYIRDTLARIREARAQPTGATRAGTGGKE